MNSRPRSAASMLVFLLGVVARPAVAQSIACVVPSDSPAKVVVVDSARAHTLAGDYDLVLVSSWEREAGRSLRGLLHLEPTDSLHRFYELGFAGRHRADDRPLWGWLTLLYSDVTVPRTADPASHDPDHPGVLLHASGRLELGVWRGNDGSSTSLAVQRVWPLGFSGHWSSDLGIRVIVKQGRVLPNPHGYFCAIRR